MTVQAAIEKPRVGLGISLGFGSWFSLSFPLLPFSLDSRSSLCRSGSSSNRDIAKVRSLSTGDKLALTVLAASSRGGNSVHQGGGGGVYYGGGNMAIGQGEVTN